jgi:hypothetical protein
MIWTISNQNETPDVYKTKLDQINEMCNNLHHGMSKIKELSSTTAAKEEEESDESGEVSYPIPENNKIKENISSMINNLPDHITRRKPATPKKTDILLKLDINKFII